MSSSSPTLARPRTLNRHFARHYGEMVVAMFVGMAALGIPAGWALGAVGSSWDRLSDDAPGLMLLLMAGTMTVPMVAWMRYRGHAWAPCLEMGAAMVFPALGVAALVGAGLVEDVGALLLIEHVVMFAAMFAVMLARPQEYSHAHC